MDSDKKELLASVIGGLLSDPLLDTPEREQDRLFLERCQEQLVERFLPGTSYVQQGAASQAIVARLIKELTAVGIEAQESNFRMDPWMVEVTV